MLTEMNDAERPRRGWREKIEPGIYRAHRLTCPRSRDHRPGGRCACPWQIVVPGVDAGTTRMVSIEGSIIEARRERHRRRAEGRPEPAVQATDRPETLNALAAAYFQAKEPVLAANTVRTRDHDYRRCIAPALGDLSLADLTRHRLEEWLAGLIGVATSRRMVVHAVATLRVILGSGVAWGHLEVNPAAGLRLPPVASHEEQGAERVLDIAQLRRLFAAAGGIRTETLLRAAGEAGLRRGELSGLKWGDVDLNGRRLNVRRQVVQLRREGDQPMRKVEQPTKGRRSRRVAISAELAERLADWYATSVVDGGAPAEGFVWPGNDGGPMHDRSANRVVARACERAGLMATDGKPIVTLHGLRHSAASAMLLAGVPLLVVSRQLGHANPQVTAVVYAHLTNDDALDLAADAFTLREPLREPALDHENRKA